MSGIFTIISRDSLFVVAVPVQEVAGGASWTAATSRVFLGGSSSW